jgi:uncharacterized membrane protein YhaH (DUF805 family)
MEPFIAAYKNAVLGNYAIDPLIFVYFLYALAVLVPGIAAGVRRLHDTGKAGVYILVGLIPCVGLILLIVWTVQAGTPGDNQYGPPPVS